MKLGLLFIIFSIVLIAQPEVISHSPAKNSIASSKSPEIYIEFSEEIKPESINDTTFMVYGKWSGVHNGRIDFEENNSKIIFNSNINFNSGELITVSLSKNIKNIDGTSLTKSFTFQFMIPTSKGTLQLTKIDQINVREDGENHIQVYGAFAGDLNEDGWTDFTVPSEISSDIRVFLNDGTGGYSNFSTYKLDAGSEPSTNEGADFNLDGHMDFAVGNAHDEFISVFFGDGTGSFFHQDVYNVGVQIRGLTVLDLNGDGFFDIVTANRESSDIALLINKGDGTFEEEIMIDGNSNGETACMSADANNDGILDLFVGSYHGEELILLLGDGDGGLIFSDKVGSGGRVWMIAVGDVDGDGFPDIAAANSTENNFSISLNNGDGTLAEAVNYDSGRFPLAIDLGDLDGDNDLDLVLSNFSSSNFEVYENDGNGNFSKAFTLSSPQAGSCAVMHDRDNDGDLDVTGIDEIEDVLILFDNDPSIVSVKDKNPVPTGIVLYQNYPNPFNPTTKIEFTIASSVNRETSNVKLIVYDILGRIVAILVNQELLPGNHKVTFDASNLSSGIYYYKLITDNFVESRKMILIQ